MRYLRGCLTLLCLSAAGGALAQGAVARQTLTIDFGDFQTRAELTYPAHGEGPFPAVVLIPGSSPEDMNATVLFYDAAGKPVVLSSIFKTISSTLSANGFAVLRYNKHYVTSAQNVDYEKFYTKLDLPQMLADADNVLKTAEANPKVDPEQVFLYGWSEGSTVAAALAVAHPELAGLIVQGPVTSSWQQLFSYQINRVGLPYLRDISPDGAVNAATLAALLAGDGGLVAKGFSSYIQDPASFSGGEPGVNPFLDTDNDGVLEPAELNAAAFDRLLDTYFEPGGFAAIYSPAGGALPAVSDQAAKLELPVLILQGTRDASVPPSGATLLDTALSLVGSKDHTLELYVGLGHTLGHTPSRLQDNFQPIAPRPLEDTVAWIEAHVTR